MDLKMSELWLITTLELTLLAEVYLDVITIPVLYLPHTFPWLIIIYMVVGFQRKKQQKEWVQRFLIQPQSFIILVPVWLIENWFVIVYGLVFDLNLLDKWSPVRNIIYQDLVFLILCRNHFTNLWTSTQCSRYLLVGMMRISNHTLISISRVF